MVQDDVTDSESDAGPSPGTAYERTTGWLGLPGVFLTAATVIFAPWVFARQIGPRSSLPHAVSFLILSFSCAFLSLPFIQETYVYEWDFLAAWLVAAAVYVPLQAGIFCFFDPIGWSRPRAALRFWIVASCYTSAIMMTEFRFGPPRLPIDALLTLLRGEYPSRTITRVDTAGLVMTVQLLLWAISLGVCYGVRLRRERISATVAWPAGAAAALLVIVLYSIVFQHVGQRLYYLLGIDEHFFG
ncbi:MAG: hypothetical protein IID33_12450 [Planctomycetes bacterium]|nr:hypothetical protein [Planctomycetota bacterium]